MLRLKAFILVLVFCYIATILIAQNNNTEVLKQEILFEQKRIDQEYWGLPKTVAGNSEALSNYLDKIIKLYTDQRIAISNLNLKKLEYKKLTGTNLVITNSFYFRTFFPEYK